MGGVTISDIFRAEIMQSLSQIQSSDKNQQCQRSFLTTKEGLKDNDLFLLCGLPMTFRLYLPSLLDVTISVSRML